MSKTYNNFSNFDVFVIVKELDLILKNATLSNIFEVEDILILRINMINQSGKKNLIIKKDSRINLTNYDYPIPKYPSQYIMGLRKFLKKRRILSVAQHNFDRIIIIKLSNLDGEPWKFIIELFNKGNFLLLDNNNIIKIARKYRKFKDRDILANREYVFPKSRGIDFLTLDKNSFYDLLNKNEDVEIVRYLARNINIAGLYSEELCYRAGIDKKTTGANLNEEDLNELYNSFKELRNQLLFGNIDAKVILDNAGTEISVIPFEIEIFKDYEKKHFDSFNIAVDEFFSKIDSDKIKTPHDHHINEKINAQDKILKNQHDYMEELIKKKKKYYTYGEFIYANFNSLEKLIKVILDARQKGYNWNDINEKLKKAKLERLEGTEFFSKLIPVNKQLIIKINDNDIYLDLNKSIGENANFIYSKGKKADKKIKGTLLAIEKTKEKIEKLKFEKESIETEVNFLIKKPKKKWYEKFRWFKSSDGFLIIGGRDASSNELIFRKYMEQNDLVFHASIPGSPLTVLKNPENKEIPESSIQEAATFVASYSRAWKEVWGVVDVFFIKPEQVSKSPPSGEFLQRGSFMITGKKIIIKNVKTELVIGLKMVEIKSNKNDGTKIFFPKIICGTKNAMQEQFDKRLIITPSKSGLTKGKLAKEIKSIYLKNSTKDMKKWVKLLSIDDINLCLPSGNSTIKSIE